MFYNKQPGVPCFECAEYEEKKNEYVVLIPIINEGKRITDELSRAKEAKVSEYVDIVICDGGSTDGCTEERRLRELGVNSLLIKKILENKVLNEEWVSGGRYNEDTKE